MAQDAQLISQAGLVESLASDGLVSVSTGAGQPQKNMELAKFADSLGSSVPLQQNAEQVAITGLYARTSDGKMVELTKESVASVVAEQIGVTQASTTINGIAISTYSYGKIVTVILSGTATSNFDYVDVYNVGLVKTFKRMKYIINGTSGYVTTRMDDDYLNINGIKEGESIGSSVDGYISFTFVRS